MAAGSIVIDLLMKTGSFETDTKRAEKRLAELKKEAQAAGAAIGVAFSAVAVASAAMVKSSIDAMDEMSKLAQSVGTSVETLSALAHAADLSGVSQEALGSAMVKLSKNISDAAKGTGDAEEAFKRMGITITNADGSLKSADKILGEMAGKFPGYAAGTEKTALAVATLGRSGADLIPLLNSGAEGLAAMMEEARTLGLVMDTETAKAAEAFNDNLTRMGAAVRGVANQAATELLPALGDVSQMMVDLAKDETAVSVATDVVKTAVGGLLTVFQTIVVLGSDVAFVFKGIGREMGAWAAQLAALARGDLQGFRAISDAVKEDGERARAELDKFQARIMSLGSGSSALDDEALRRLGRGPSAPVLASAPRLTDGKKPTKGKDQDSDFRTYLNGLQQQVQKVHELTAAEKLLDDIRRGSLTVTAAQREQLMILATTVDKDKELTEQRKLRRDTLMAEVDAITKANEEYQSLLKRLLDAGPAAQLEKQRKEMQLLADAFMRGDITAAQFEDAAKGALDLIAEKLPETKSMMEELGMTFASAAEEALFAGADMSDVFKGLLMDIARVIFRLQVMEPLLKRLKDATSGGGGSSGGGFFSSVVSAIAGAFGGGGVTPPNPFYGGARAGGGDVLPGRSYDVGEFGPERFVPRTAGSIVPAHQTAAERLSIINQTTGRADQVIERRISPRDRAIILKENRNAIRAELFDPNSELSLAMQKNLTVRRNRA